MTIDINELRRLAQAAMTGPDGVSLNWVKLLQDFQKEASPAAVSELLDRLELAEKSDAESISMYRKSRDERDALRAKVSDLMINAAFLDNLKKSYEELIEELQDERDRLRAKIEVMKEHPPYVYIDKILTEVMDNAAANGADSRSMPDEYVEVAAWLCGIPGAQPAPIIPEGWKPIPEKHPTFELVDLRLADGSVLCGCVPQSDGDYWWEGPSGEVFIDPRYAPATHWRLAATPEAKP